MTSPIMTPITKAIVIEGFTFIIRPLGPIDLVSLAMLEGDIASIIKFVVEHGTVEPKIEDANNVRADIILELAENIQRFTSETIPQIDDFDEKIDKPPSGMIV